MADGTTQSALRYCQCPPDLDDLMRDAADKMDAMEAEIERLRTVLADIEAMNPTVTTLMCDGSWRDAHRDLQRIARLALKAAQ